MKTTKRLLGYTNIKRDEKRIHSLSNYQIVASHSSQSHMALLQTP